MKALFVCLSALLPTAAFAVSLAVDKQFKEEKYRERFMTFALVLSALAALPAVLGLGGDAHVTLHITNELALLFKVDNLSRLFLALINIMFLLVGIYSLEYMRHEKYKVGFYRFYMLTLAALDLVAIAGNYATLYMAFEFMTLLSFPMVMNSREEESVQGARKYLFYSIGGACLGLFGFFFLAPYADVFGFAAGGSLIASKVAGHETLILVVTLLSIMGFGAKGGMFPLHSWLPSAHPVAPSPASAVMSGVITKAGVLAIIRVVYYTVGADFLRGTWVHYTWMILALITVFMGSMLAYMENGFKKRLAYSSVSQVSYVLFGLSTLTPVGMVGALMHVIFHSVIKDLLFMCAGAVIIRTGATKVDQLRGMGKRMPIVMWTFTIASLGLVGIPPTGGFVSKWFLAMGSLESGMGALTWIGPVVLLTSALLTAGYLLTISVAAFLPGDDFDYANVEKAEPSRLMIVPMIILAAAVIVLGICVTPMQSFFAGIAQGLM